MTPRAAVSYVAASGTGGVGHVGVEQRAERVLCLPECDDWSRKKKLLLPFGEIPKGGSSMRDIELALSLLDCGRDARRADCR